MLAALMLSSLLAAVGGDATTPVLDATANCLNRAGINAARAQILAVHSDGDAVTVNFILGDTGQHATYLAKTPQGWECLGTTGGVISTYTLNHLASAFREAHVPRSALQLRNLHAGTRGKTLLRPTKPLLLGTLISHPPRTL